MGLIGSLLAFPVMGPIRGLAFIADKLAEQGMLELLDEDRIRQQLMELELLRDIGEMDREEYLAREAELFERLDMIQVYREQNP